MTEGITRVGDRPYFAVLSSHAKALFPRGSVRICLVVEVIVSSEDIEEFIFGYFEVVIDDTQIIEILLCEFFHGSSESYLETFFCFCASIPETMLHFFDRWR
jgi:hypothetical protein